MTKEKQIEEMARDLENHTCMSEYHAEIASKTLYIKGYRKASEVAREIIDCIEAVLNKMFEEYAVLGQADCCMITEIIWRKLSAELKKKYTEEGK